MLFVLSACVSKKEATHNDNIIGRWEAKFNNLDLMLKFTKDTLLYDDLESKTEFKCKYSINNDTLFLQRADSLEKHFISRVDLNTLKLDNLYGEYKDVPALDGLIFNRIR